MLGIIDRLRGGGGRGREGGGKFVKHISFCFFSFFSFVRFYLVWSGLVWLLYFHYGFRHRMAGW